MTIVRLTRRRLTQAVAALSAQDPKMSVAIERVGPCTMLPRADGTHFDHLARVVPFVGGLGDVQAFIALQPHQPPAEGAGQHLGDLGLADTGRTDHQDVLGRDLGAQRLRDLHAPPAVAQRDGDRALGSLLTDDMFIELGDDLARCQWVAHACSTSMTRLRLV